MRKNKKTLVLVIVSVFCLLTYCLLSKTTVYKEGGQKIRNCKDCLIPDEITAIKIAEAILFSYYGEGRIKQERPYVIKLVDNTWVITGTLNKGISEKFILFGIPKLGGVFEIKISAKDGKVINITHGK